MENNRFEDSFRNAFNGAEISPSETVWTNIELDLEKSAGGKLKRNLLMFQLLAAASVAFALGVSAIYYLNQPVDQPNTVTQTVDQPTEKKAAELPTTELSTDDTNQKAGNALTDNKGIAQEKSIGESLKSEIDADKTIIPSNKNGQAENSHVGYTIARTDLSSFIKIKQPVFLLPEPGARVEPDPVMLLMAQLKDIEKKYQEEDKKTAPSDEKIWASLGFGAGSYKPNREVLSNQVSSQSNNGEAYSVGLNVAGRVSRRIILQGGISYLTQNADFTSTSSNKGHASLSEYTRPANFSQGSDYESGVNAYQVNSSLQFVSIPLQAGYLIVDRAFGIQLNGGIATDLFINNTLSPENTSYQKVTQAAGKDSPYRTVNFSGLLGSEFSYRIADQYRISVNPGLRYSLNSIYKGEIAAAITPVTFDVSLRFRYIFK